MIDAPTTPPQAQHQRKGLAIAALVLGLVAILGCLIPVLNIISILIAVVGLGLGIAALVLSRRPSHGGKGMAIAGTILSVLAIIGAVLANLLFGAAINAADQAVTDAENGFSEVAPEEVEAAEATALELGQQAQLGEYTVAITAVTKDAGEDIAAENEFNEPADGQYVVADLDVSYTGDDEGDPWLDLGVDYQGADNRNYSTTTCDAVVANGVMDQPTLRAGGSTTYSICFDVPTDAVEGGLLAVEEGLGINRDPAFWAVP